MHDGHGRPRMERTGVCQAFKVALKLAQPPRASFNLPLAPPRHACGQFFALNRVLVVGLLSLGLTAGTRTCEEFYFHLDRQATKNTLTETVPRGRRPAAARSRAHGREPSAFWRQCLACTTSESHRRLIETAIAIARRLSIATPSESLHSQAVLRGKTASTSPAGSYPIARMLQRPLDSDKDLVLIRGGVIPPLLLPGDV